MLSRSDTVTDIKTSVLKVQKSIFTGKQQLIDTLSPNQRESFLAFDDTTSGKIELLKLMQSLSVTLHRVCVRYAHCLDLMAFAEAELSQIFQEYATECQSDAASFLLDVGSMFAMFSKHRNAMKSAVTLLRDEVQTFSTKAISDTRATVRRMNAAQSKYKGMLAWMEKSTTAVDPESFGDLNKFRKIQSDVRSTLRSYEQLKSDVRDKVNMLCGSRCSMFSNALSSYFKALLEFCEYTNLGCQKVLNNGPIMYRFSAITNLNDLPDQQLRYQLDDDEIEELTHEPQDNESPLLLNFETNDSEDDEILLGIWTGSEMLSSNEMTPKGRKEENSVQNVMHPLVPVTPSAANYQPSTMMFGYQRDKRFSCNDPDLTDCAGNNDLVSEEPRNERSADGMGIWSQWLEELGSAEPNTDLSHIFETRRDKSLL